MKRWFSYDYEGVGITFHDTAEAAMAAAQTSLDLCAENAEDGWPDGVEEIGWGEVKGWVKEVDRRPWRQYLMDDLGYDEAEADAADLGFIDYVDYALRPPQ